MKKKSLPRLFIFVVVPLGLPDSCENRIRYVTLKPVLSLPNGPQAEESPGTTALKILRSRLRIAQNDILVTGAGEG